MLVQEDDVYVWFFTNSNRMRLVATLGTFTSSTPIGEYYKYDCEEFYEKVLDVDNTYWTRLETINLLDILYGLTKEGHGL